MQWGELEIKLRESNGCVVVEWLSFKGPTRWWWLDDGIRATDLLKVEEEDTPENLYVPLDMGRWETHYTGPGGKATLICGTSHEKKTAMAGPFQFKEGVNAFLVAPFLAKTANRSS